MWLDKEEDALRRAADLRITKIAEVSSLEEEVSRLRVEVSQPTPTASVQGAEGDEEGEEEDDQGHRMSQDNESMPEEYLAPDAARKKLRRGQDDPVPPAPSPAFSSTVVGGYWGSLGRDVGYVGNARSLG